MKDAHFAKQDHRHATALTLDHLGTQFLKKAFDIAPLDVGAGRAGKDEFKRALVFSLHGCMVPIRGT